MCIESLAADLENEYEGSVGAYTSRSGLYKTELPTDDPDLVLVQTFSFKTHEQVGCDEIMPRTTYNWKNK